MRTKKSVLTLERSWISASMPVCQRRVHEYTRQADELAGNHAEAGGRAGGRTGGRAEILRGGTEALLDRVVVRLAVEGLLQDVRADLEAGSARADHHVPVALAYLADVLRVEQPLVAGVPARPFLAKQVPAHVPGVADQGGACESEKALCGTYLPVSVTPE